MIAKILKDEKLKMDFNIYLKYRLKGDMIKNVIKQCQ